MSRQHTEETTATHVQEQVQASFRRREVQPVNLGPISARSQQAVQAQFVACRLLCLKSGRPLCRLELCTSAGLTVLHASWKLQRISFHGGWEMLFLEESRKRVASGPCSRMMQQGAWSLKKSELLKFCNSTNSPVPVICPHKIIIGLALEKSSNYASSSFSLKTGVLQYETDQNSFSWAGKDRELLRLRGVSGCNCWFGLAEISSKGFPYEIFLHHCIVFSYVCSIIQLPSYSNKVADDMQFDTAVC